MECTPPPALFNLFSFMVLQQFGPIELYSQNLPTPGELTPKDGFLLRPALAPLLPAIGHGWAWAGGASAVGDVSVLYNNTTIGRITVSWAGVGRVKAGLSWVLLSRVCFFSQYVFHPCDLLFPDHRLLK